MHSLFKRRFLTTKPIWSSLRWYFDEYGRIQKGSRGFFAGQILDKRAPLTPYIQFAQHEREAVVKANPDATFTEIGQLLGTRWKSLNEEQKQVYKDQYMKKRKEFQGFSAIEIAYNKELRLQKKTKRKKRKFRKILKETNMPRKPPGAYFLYLETLNPGDGPRSIFTAGASMRWRQLAIEDKQEFVDRAEELKRQYEKDLFKWYEEMIETGRSELVPIKKLSKIHCMPEAPRKNIFAYFLKARTGYGENKRSYDELLYEWRNLSTKEKLRLGDEYQMKVEQYEKDLTEWKEQMKIDGKEKELQLLKELWAKSGRKQATAKVAKGEPIPPTSAYNKWFNEYRENFLRENPGKRMQMRSAREVWKNLQDKSKYTDEYHKERKNYEERMREYLTKKGKSRSTSKREKDVNTPKRPMSPYLIWLNDNRDRLLRENPDIKWRDLLQKSADEWNKLEEKQKSNYRAEYEVRQDRYKKELDLYEKRKLKLIPSEHELSSSDSDEET